MADRKFIESLKIEDNIFELKESCIIGYLIIRLLIQEENIKYQLEPNSV